MSTSDQSKPLRIHICDTRDGWTTLRRAIPDGTAKAVASRLRVTADHVRRWRREPLSDEAPLSNGQRSPLDRLLDLLDGVFLSNQLGAALIVEHIRDHHEQLLQAADHGQEWDRRAHAADTLREATEAVTCLFMEETPDDNALTELIEARGLIDEAIRKIQSRRGATQQAHVDTRQGAQQPVRVGGNASRLSGGARR